MGNARGGVLGDTLASVLTACGADVTREFYVNDAGHQIDKFAHSIEARYLQIIQGEDAVPFPEDGYQGGDIRDLAQAYYDQHGEGASERPAAERQEKLAQFGLPVNLPKMKSDLARYKIHDTTGSMSPPSTRGGYVAETVDLLTEKGWTYEKDGALWLKTADILREHFRKAGKEGSGHREAGPEGRRAAPGQRVLTPTLPPTSPITATSSPSGALTGSSTSGAPTTTAMWPG